ncbi:MAG: DUF2268 domain-containing protein [Gemmatimonadetes bacterium]|nr:DUF2268 domain-containing protein [Gemmatimonadota bacterium]
MTLRAFAFAWLTLLVGPFSIAAQSDVLVQFAETAAFEFRGAPPPDLALHETLSDQEKVRIENEIQGVEREVRRLMPALADEIRVTVVLVDRDLRSVGGVSGRADAPGELLIELSTTFEGGVPALLPGLSRAMFHELHHLVRGWTIVGNRFGPGIPIAAVNEGLADVFADEQTGVVLAANEYPEQVSAWAREIMSLPVDASYGDWMFEHPDGRRAIGYRTGRYIVHQAMANSGKSVLELSELSPAEILDLAGLDGSRYDQMGAWDPESGARSTRSALGRAALFASVDRVGIVAVHGHDLVEGARDSS